MIWHRLACLALAASSTALRTNSALAEGSQPYDVVEQFAEVLSVLENEYVEPPQRENLAQGAIAGMVAVLDPHSAYMTPTQYDEFKQDTSGKFAGIGVEVDLRNGQVTVVAPFAGSPAEKAGLKSGDRIIAVDNIPLDSLPMSEIVRRMRGARRTTVHLLIRRTGSSAPIRLDLVREEVSLPSVYTHTFDGQIAYVRITAFQDGTHTELLSKLGSLLSQLGQCKGMILDLRQNPGGLVAESIAVADEFLGTGPLFSIRHRGMVVVWVETTGYGHFEKTPLITLVDSGSASAAEIVAGALKDRKRSQLIGERTFGKGTVQSIIDLSAGAGLRLTSLRYYTPSGYGIQASGVQPDTEVVSQDRHVDAFRESDLPGHLPSENGKVEVAAAEQEATPAPCTPPKPMKTLAQRISELTGQPSAKDDEPLTVAYQLLRKQLHAH